MNPKTAAGSRKSTPVSCASFPRPRAVFRLKSLSVCLFLVVISAVFSAPATARSRPVGITPTLKEITVRHHGKPFVIRRNPDNSATIDPAYAKTSRPCPPFCIQPMRIAPGVETVGELEVIDYLDQKYNHSKGNIDIVDSRTPEWVAHGTIPGSINLPWTRLEPRKGAATEDVIRLLKAQFGVTLTRGADVFSVEEVLATGKPGDVFDFSQAHTLVLFCNGMWCGQSPNNIRNLLKLGYPAARLKWYRGGMQDWSALGLSTAHP